MGADRQLVLAVATTLLGACAAPPFGEVLVVVDTNLSVPEHVDALRVDLYSRDDWYESREFVALQPEQWPLSFSLRTEESGTKWVRLRLRAYPAAAQRDYRGERFLPWPPFSEQTLPKTEAALCASVPDLPAGV